jgi:signal transduction histidine kinase
MATRERTAEEDLLRAELDATRAQLAALVERLDPGADAAAEPIADIAKRLEALVAERDAAFEAANHELRSLTQNLDQIVRQRTRALAESESQLRRKNAELDRLNKIRAEFIAIAAHELRTPMTTVVGYLDLIADKRMQDLPDELRRPMTNLRRNAHRLKRLIDDMLDVSRIESGRVVLRRAPMDLGDVALQAVEELRPLAAGKQQKVATHIADMPPIDADPDKIFQVATNLIVNAIKYTPEGGEIRVQVDAATTDNDRRVGRLRVWDSGIGIPPELRQRIFEPFLDVHTAKHHTSNNPDSAGLGLYIARGIVELHGGTISVETVPGQFTEFTVLLPLSASASPPSFSGSPRS